MTLIGQMTGQVMNPIMDMTEITPKVIGTIGLILLPLRKLTASEDKHQDVIPEDGQTDKINQFCFFRHSLVPIIRTRTCRGSHIRASVSCL